MSSEVDALIEKFNAHMEQEENDRRDFAEALRSLKVAMYGDGQGPGLFERMRTLERIADGFKKLQLWFAVGVGGLILNLAFDAVTWYLENQGASTP